ncbi:MAG: rRNA maturation RNase YbeY [Longimicrobiales bacterium]
MNELRVEVNLADGVHISEPDVEPLIERAVRSALESEGVADADISVTLLLDPEISTLNQQYLKHEGPTDVISFPLFADGEAPVGDIYIGYEQARRQSDELTVPLTAELARLAIHGTLHVLGYDHAGGSARETDPMWQRQETILQQVLGR